MFGVRGPRQLAGRDPRADQRQSARGQQYLSPRGQEDLQADRPALPGEGGILHHLRMRRRYAGLVDLGRRYRLHVGEKGVARNAHFDVLGYPVVPLPYALFPADSTRQSGFLSPRMGYSGLRGAQYLQPYYWAINKSSDATAALDVETSSASGCSSEYRLQNGTRRLFAG